MTDILYVVDVPDVWVLIELYLVLPMAVGILEFKPAIPILGRAQAMALMARQ